MLHPQQSWHGCIQPVAAFASGGFGLISTRIIIVLLHLPTFFIMSIVVITASLGVIIFIQLMWLMGSFLSCILMRPLKSEVECSKKWKITKVSPQRLGLQRLCTAIKSLRNQGIFWKSMKVFFSSFQKDSEKRTHHHSRSYLIFNRSHRESKGFGLLKDDFSFVL